MTVLLDFIYLFVFVIFSPWLIYKAVTTGKYRRGLRQKLFGLAPVRAGDRPCAWFHGVSVGEIHLLRQLVQTFRRRHPDWDCVISTTTDTGFEEAKKHFAGLSVFCWPLDFSWAVRRAVRRVRPQLVVLAEGELWPNFVAAAKNQGTRVAVVNGRMSPRSFRRHRYLRLLTRTLLAKLDLIAVQTEEYAEHFRALGGPPARVHVTGSVKYDGIVGSRDHPRTRELARLLGIEAGELVWIAGSTQAPEEEIALRVFARARALYPRLRLLIVPRQRDRFDEVAGLLQQSGRTFVRRSQLTSPSPVGEHSDLILVDTIGELGALWGLADVAFVGGSLDGRRGGQNMIEPAACGAAVVFGPHVWNFRDTAARLLAADAAVQAGTAAELEAVVMRLLGDAPARQRLGAAARAFVRGQQGATERTLELLDRFCMTGGSEQAA
jgi:3-deoxy-D-manno-octulosonic-acid transferase